MLEKLFLTGILGSELDQQGFRLYDEEDYVDLWYRGKLVATWYGSTATPDLIKQAARAWLKEHGGE